MLECYKLVFDLSLYFTVFGYYLILLARIPPSAAGFLLLAAAAALDAFLRSRQGVDRSRLLLRAVPLMLPLAVFLTRPTLWQALHLLPVWIYFAWSMLTDRVVTDYRMFRGHFSFALRLLLLLVFGPLFPGQFSEAILRSIPYLVVLLAVGVSLLRMLREERPSGARQGILMAGFVLACALLTVGRAPQLLLKLIGIVYQNVIAPAIYAVVIVVAALFYWVYLIAEWLVSRAKGAEEPLNIELQDTAEMLGLGNQYEAITTDLRWLRALLIILGCALLIFLLFLLFRRMLGNRSRPVKAGAWAERSGPETADAALHAGSRRLIRPRDPRLAVRYDYGRFLAECRARAVPLRAGMTPEELTRACARAFPGADPASLTALYLPARYSASISITREQAIASAEALRALKRSERPDNQAKRNGKEKYRKKP